MRIISIINLKGGVGKTMTALELGYILHHKYGQSVLLVDNDKQGNLSQAMGKHYAEDHICGTAQLLNGQDVNKIMRFTGEPGLGVVNADMSLLTSTYQLMGKSGEKVGQFETLHNARAEDGKPYDYIIIDNPPDMGINVINALMVTDDVIVPVKLDQWALDGLETIKNQISECRERNPGIKLLGILVTMYRNNDANVAGVEWLQDQGYKMFKEKIRYSEKVAESIMMGKPLEEYSPRSAAAVSYRRFVEEYRRMVGE